MVGHAIYVSGMPLVAPFIPFPDLWYQQRILPIEKKGSLKANLSWIDMWRPMWNMMIFFSASNFGIAYVKQSQRCISAPKMAARCPKNASGHGFPQFPFRGDGPVTIIVIYGLLQWFIVISRDSGWLIGLLLVLLLPARHCGSNGPSISRALEAAMLAF